MNYQPCSPSSERPVLDDPLDADEPVPLQHAVRGLTWEFIERFTRPAVVVDHATKYLAALCCGGTSSAA